MNLLFNIFTLYDLTKFVSKIVSIGLILFFDIMILLNLTRLYTVKILHNKKDS